MIMVDIYFPVVDLVYNFRLDEQSRISSLIQEINEMMCKKYKSVFDKNQEKFVLCSLDQNRILSKDATLGDYQVKNGSRLIMV